MALTDEDLRGLSESERQILIDAEADDTDGDIARELGLPAAADDAPPAKVAKEVPGDGEPEADDDAAAAAAAAAAPAPAPAAAPAAAPAPADGAPPTTTEEEPEAAPPPSRAAPADIADQRTALNQREDESMQKLLDGEITQDEHAKVKNEVRAKLDELLVLEATDRATEKIERDGMMKIYNADLAETIKQGKAAGLDYKGDLKAAFDRAVVMFSNELAEQGIFDTPGNLTNSKQALKEAHELMLRRNGKAAPAPAPTPAPAPAPAAAKRLPPDRSKLPPTLAGVPAASDATIASEFAHLDALDGDPAALERALARLTPEQQERYLGE